MNRIHISSLGLVSRPFDMACFSAMFDFMAAGDPERAAMEGLSELAEISLDELSQDETGEMIAAMDDLKRWFLDAQSELKGDSGGRLLSGHPLRALYKQLFDARGILPDTIDRQDPKKFFQILTEKHMSETDIPSELRGFYGL